MKHFFCHFSVLVSVSRSARGAWIETIEKAMHMTLTDVALRPGRVD